ncbi:hypothetical protein OPQ81_006451 [Rhizoctonia solani]|nr:hypothetical protein OPQ81_006451 [Rhizoctonia solani]
MVVGRIAFFREDVSCVIGLKPFSSLTLLIYDLCMNVFLNSMFLWPLLRSKLINPRLRAVARRTLVAAAAALAISIINIAILTAMKHQLGWVCLGSCGIDVTLNAVIIFWVTMPMTDSPAAQVQQSASYTKPGSDLPQAPAMTNSTILFSHQEAAQASSASATVLKPPGMMHQQSPQAHDLRHVSVLQELPRFPDPPTEPSPSSEDVSMPLPAVRVKDADERPSLSSNTQGSIHWLRKLLGLPAKRDKDMEVCVSVVTQQGVEMRALENGQVKQGDGKSMDRVKLRSGWVK